MESAFNRPAVAIEPSVQGDDLDATFTRPFAQGLRAAVVCNQPDVATVPILLFRCRPARVIGLVVTIVVSAVNRMSRRRARTDIGKECLKGRVPTRTHADSSCAVGCKPHTMGGATSTAHFYPCSVFGRPMPSVANTVILEGEWPHRQIVLQEAA